MTAKKTSKTDIPNWSNLKSRLAQFDRAGLVALVHDLYAASRDNQVFLHTRFGLCEDPISPYKRIISRCLWPSIHKNQHVSVSSAKKAISDYKKAVGAPVQLVELMVFYCEQAAGFSAEFAFQDDAYFDALARMFDQALRASMNLEMTTRDAFHQRLKAVRETSGRFGYGVEDDMCRLLNEYGLPS
jgi:hypothetical protein